MSAGNGRVAMALEGGYELMALCASAEACMKALLGLEVITLYSGTSLIWTPGDHQNVSISRNFTLTVGSSSVSDIMPGDFKVVRIKQEQCQSLLYLQFPFYTTHITGIRYTGMAIVLSYGALIIHSMSVWRPWPRVWVYEGLGHEYECMKALVTSMSVWRPWSRVWVYEGLGHECECMKALAMRCPHGGWCKIPLLAKKVSQFRGLHDIIVSLTVWTDSMHTDSSLSCFNPGNISPLKQIFPIRPIRSKHFKLPHSNCVGIIPN